MAARFILATLLIFTGVACEKEIQEVRAHDLPMENLARASHVPDAADRL